MLGGVDHGVAGAVALDQVIQEFVHRVEVLAAECGVPGRRLTQVIGRANTVLAAELSQLPDILQVGARDVDAQEDGIAVAVLLLYQVVEVRPDGIERFGQAWFFADAVNGHVEGSDPGIREAIGHSRCQQASIGRKVEITALSRRVPDELFHEG